MRHLNSLYIWRTLSGVLFCGVILLLLKDREIIGFDSHSDKWGVIESTTKPRIQQVSSPKSIRLLPEGPRKLSDTDWRRSWADSARLSLKEAFNRFIKLDDAHPTQKNSARHALFEVIDTLDPDAVWKTATDSLLNDSELQILASHLFVKAPDADPLRAVDQLSGRLSSRGLSFQSGSSNLIADFLAKSNAESSVAALNRIAETDSSFAAEVAESSAQIAAVDGSQQGLEFVRMLRSSGASGELMESALQGLAVQAKSPEDFSDLANEISQNYAELAYGSAPIRLVTALWSRTDAVSASEFLSGLTEGTFRDAAVAGFVGTMQKMNPDAADAWMGSIKDPGQKKWAAGGSDQRNQPSSH